jgi:acyl carrier protein
MATNKEVTKVVKDEVARLLCLEEGREVTGSLEDLGADSLDIVELIMELEEDFNVEIDESKDSSVKTVEDLIRVVKESQ